jgi:hypothetical protein
MFMDTASIKINYLPMKDVATQGNSTFLMIKSGLPFRLAVENFATVDSHHNDCTSPEEWSQLAAMKDFLAIFYKCKHSYFVIHCMYTIPTS